MEMDAETKRRIEEAVVEILQSANMEEATEYKVRAAASERLGLDLSFPDRKLFVRSIVESFLLSKKSDVVEADDAVADEEKEEEEEEEEDAKRSRGGKEYDDDGDLIICRLSNKRRVTIQDFRGRTLVSIREYYEKGGKQMPSSKDPLPSPPFMPEYVLTTPPKLLPETVSSSNIASQVQCRRRKHEISENQTFQQGRRKKAGKDPEKAFQSRSVGQLGRRQREREERAKAKAVTILSVDNSKQRSVENPHPQPVQNDNLQRVPNTDKLDC